MRSSANYRCLKRRSDDGQVILKVHPRSPQLAPDLEYLVWSPLTESNRRSSPYHQTANRPQQCQAAGHRPRACTQVRPSPHRLRYFRAVRPDAPPPRAERPDCLMPATSAVAPGPVRRGGGAPEVHLAVPAHKPRHVPAPPLSHHPHNPHDARPQLYPTGYPQPRRPCQGIRPGRRGRAPGPKRLGHRLQARASRSRRLVILQETGTKYL